MKRTIYTVSWDKESKEWLVHGPPASFKSKGEAIHKARLWAQAKWIDEIPSQLVIKGKNGRIQTEYTYGKDPRRFKG